MVSKVLNISMDKFLARQERWQYKLWKWWYYTKVGNFLSELNEFFKNLIKWRKVLWNDRDWDHRYIYETLRFKIEKTADYIDGTQRSVGYKTDVVWMRICVTLLDRIGDDYYGMESYNYKETKMEFSEPDENGNCVMDVNMVEDRLDEYFALYPLQKKRAIKYIQKNRKRYTVDENDREFIASTIGRLREEKAHRLVFEIISRKIKHWWD